MKQHTSEFKEQIKTLGRQQDVQITYDDITLNTEQINSVTFSYQGGLLKSVMKELEIDSNEIIPVGTQINFKYGILVNYEYEYLDYGTFIVKEVEKQEDSDSYVISCYDKLLYSMKEYERVNVTYPTTINNYLRALCNKIGLNLSNEATYNGDKALTADLFDGINYTYRDVLDDIAEATGSVICIDSNDNVEIRQITETLDTIDEEYFKDINVNFGEKYGPINSIVLSRSGESDNVYLQDEQSVQENGLCEIKIVDNQIMNLNNRSEFLPDLLSALGGIEYYLNDYSSTGIMYYDLLDRYTVHIGDNYYSCVMLNDEQNITQGLEEQVYTDRPETSETDYTKADKTDQKINQTYIIVDKQNQRIDSVVSNVNEQNNKISQITQTVDELNSKISDISDITTSAESLYAKVELTGINESEPISINIKPTVENISYLYPNSGLFPSNTTYLKVRTLRFINTRTNEYLDYILPDDLLMYDNENCDEFILNYDSQTCQVIKKCKYNADGTVGLLDETITTDYDYPKIALTEGDYTVILLGYTNAYLSVRLMASNIYTSQFAIKVEIESQIKQTAQDITLGVNKTLQSYPTTTQMNSAISISANNITSNVSKTYATKGELNNTQNTLESKIEQTESSITSIVSSTYATKNELNTAKSSIKQTTDSISTEVSKKVGNNEIISKINQSAEAVQINANKINLNGKQINLTSDNIKINSTNFSVDNNGNMSCNNASIKDTTITDGSITLDAKGNNVIQVHAHNNMNERIYINENYLGVQIGGRDLVVVGNVNQNEGWIELSGNGYTVVRASGITTPHVTQTSRAEEKKNFEKMPDNALQILKQIDIYKYNLKNEKDEDKKHIGFVIGDEYNYSTEVTSLDNKGVDNYSFTSLCAKAIQEQQKIIEQLQKEIKDLKECDK